MPDDQLSFTGSSVAGAIDFQSAVCRSGAGFSLADPTGRYLYANKSFCQMTGYTREELCERDVLSIVHPDDREKNVRLMHKLLDGGGPNYLIEERIVRKTGECIMVEHTLSAILDKAGGVAQIVGVTHDLTERENYRHALEDSERRYRALFDDSPSPIYVFDEDTLEFLAVNRTALNQYGYTLKEFMALKWSEIRPPAEVPKALQALNLENSEISKGTNWRHRRKDGTLFDAAIVAHRINFDGRKARVAIVRDVTESRKAEIRLRDSEERFRSTFDHAAMGMAHVSPNGRWLRVNQKLCEILGYAPGRLIKLGWQDISLPADMGSSIDIRRRILDGEMETSTTEKQYIRADGSLIWAKVTISLVRPSDPAPPYFVAAIEDISQAKNIEHELQLSEARFRALTENSADRTLVVDAEGTVTFVSASSEHIFGYSPEEVAGHRFFDFLHPEDVDPTLQVFWKLVGDPGGSAHLRYRAPHKDGRLLWVDCRGFNALENPAVGGIVINERDITQEKELEAQFLRAQRLESVGTLASGIAHDLNNILAPILMSAPMLRQDLDEHMRENLVSTIEASAQRGADIVRQILTFTRGIEGERLLLQPLHILKEVGNIAQETFPKNIVIHVQYGRDVWPVYGDPTQLHQVLMNLTVNARDAMPAGGTLTLAAQNVAVDEQYAATLKIELPPGDYLRWSVTDTGTGIPPEIKDRIFDPFFTTKETGKGTGLGLSTVIGIVRAHQGGICVDSEVGNGTNISIFLPATPGEACIEPQCDETEQVPGAGELVLVVDDERGVLEMSRLVLERAGYRIAIARDGIEGLAFYARHVDEVAVVLTDIHMPNFDGLALVSAMRRLHPDIPIIGSSGQTLGDEEQKLKELGVDRFLKKPYTKRQLLSAIGELLIRQPAASS